MNTQQKLSLLLILVLILSLALGTTAYYKKTFSSDANVVRAARFVVSTDGTLDEDKVFDLTDTPIYPGVELEVYNFKIDKTGTEVPVEYEITVTPYGELFEPVETGNSPVNLTILQKKVDNWKSIGGLEKVIVEPEKDIEEFKVHLNWDHTEYDIEYQGKGGTVKIEVIATQIDGDISNGNKDYLQLVDMINNLPAYR